MIESARIFIAVHERTRLNPITRDGTKGDFPQAAFYPRSFSISAITDAALGSSPSPILKDPTVCIYGWSGTRETVRLAGACDVALFEEKATWHGASWIH